MSQPNLNEDLNIVANSNIEITLLDGDLNIIQALDDEPNDVGGLTSAELKAKFDEGPNKIKTYINETLIPEILTEEATEADRAAAEAVREANEAQRIENENARIAAEQARVDETNGVVAQANQAAQSWAVGGTGTREGEDTNNAKYWSEKAKEAAGGDFIPNSARGVPDGVATLDKDGKVPSDQLPSMDYVPATEKGAENGIATLGADGKLTASQIPEQKIMAITNAAEYSATATYAEGAYCTRSGKLYRCTTAITEVEDWTEAHWTETSVGAELTELARQLSESGSFSLDLLYENAAPTSVFPEQIISLDLSRYDFLLLHYNVEANSNQNYPFSNASACCLLVKGKNQIRAMGIYGSTIATRAATVSDTQILFSGGYYCNSVGGTTRTSHDYTIIPIRIYGITTA